MKKLLITSVAAFGLTATLTATSALAVDLGTPVSYTHLTLPTN